MSDAESLAQKLLERALEHEPYRDVFIESSNTLREQASRIAALEAAINTARVGIEVGSYSIALDALQAALEGE